MPGERANKSRDADKGRPPAEFGVEVKMCDVVVAAASQDAPVDARETRRERTDTE